MFLQFSFLYFSFIIFHIINYIFVNIFTASLISTYFYYASLLFKGMLCDIFLRRNENQFSPFLKKSIIQMDFHINIKNILNNRFILL